MSDKPAAWRFVEERRGEERHGAEGRGEERKQGSHVVMGFGLRVLIPLRACARVLRDLYIE